MIVIVIIFLFFLSTVKCDILKSPQSCEDHHKFLVLIHSAPYNRQLRESMRKTWLSNSLELKSVFFIGHSAYNETLESEVLQELEEFQDIAFIDIEDSYRNLTQKHLSAYKWALEHCPTIQFVLKTDDDVFVDSIHLENYLMFNKFDEITKTQKFFICVVIADAKPVRDPESSLKKWFLTKDEYPEDSFPPYCSGTAYLTNIETIRSILSTINQLDLIFIDDLLLTGLAVEKYNSRNLDSIDLYDWSHVFLHTHTSEEENLFNPNIGYYSPEMLVAINLQPNKVLWNT